MPLLTYPKFQAPDINGVNMAGGLVYFYITGTTTPKDTYSDEAKTVPNANPVVLDARGEADIYLDGEYKIILKTAADVEVWTVDSFSGNTLVEDLASTTAGKGAALVKFESGYTIQDLASTATDDGTKGRNLVYVPPRSDSSETGIENHAFARNNILRFIPYSLHDGIRAGTNTTVLDTYIANAIASQPNGGELLVDQGTYLIGSTVNVNKKITIIGVGFDINNVLNIGTSFRKKSTLNGTGIYITADGAKITNLCVNGEAGNGGDGIVVAARSVHLGRIGVFSQGQDGIRLGEDSSTNCNLWYMENIVTASNTRHGIKLHSNTGGSPDVNGGVAIQIDSRTNGSDGIHSDNAWINTFFGATVQSNTGYGINETSNGANNRWIGGDQDETNVAGNINSAGTGSVYVGVSDGGFVDSGTDTLRLTRLITKLKKLGIGVEPTELFQIQTANAGGLDNISDITSEGNAAADRGVVYEYNLPISGGSSLAAKIIIAREGVADAAYFEFVTKDGSTLTSKVRFDSDGDVNTLIAGKGLVVKTPDGTKNYRIAVDNAGAITSTLV